MVEIKKYKTGQDLDPIVFVLKLNSTNQQWLKKEIINKETSL